MTSIFHNYQPFDVGLLLFPGIVLFISLFILGYLGSKSLAIAWSIATIKTSLFILYFGFLFDGTYTSLDDEVYLTTGQQLYQLFGGDISEIRIDQMQAIVGGTHIIYNIINAIAFLFFGEYYFSPVVINIIISAFAAVISVRIIKEQKILRETQLNYFFILLCLHPELLSWSTVFNGKDTLVLFMNVLLLHSVSLFILQRKMAAFFTGFLAIFVLLGLRFYVPFIFGLSFLIYLIIYKKLNLKKVLNFGFILSLFLLFVVPWDFLSYSLEVYKQEFINPLTGVVHFMLTPRPFFTDEIHGFLNFASLINWILFPIFLMGIYVGFKSRNKFIYFLLAYLLIFTLFYGGIFAFNGPRHRLQLLFAIATFQFIGLQWFVRQMLLQKTTSSPDKAGTQLASKN